MPGAQHIAVSFFVNMTFVTGEINTNTKENKREQKILIIILIQKQGPEIDISVSKLLSFETFADFLRVLVSVSEKKVSVSENLV